MTAVPIRALRPYEVCIAPGLLPDLGPRAAALLPPRRAMLVSDDQAYPLYGPAAEASLTHAGFPTEKNPNPSPPIPPWCKPCLTMTLPAAIVSSPWAVAW